MKEKKIFKVRDIVGYFGLFLDDEVEADDEIEAKEMIQDEIIDNIGNYIDIELEEIDNEEDII